MKGKSNILGFSGGVKIMDKKHDKYYAVIMSDGKIMGMDTSRQ